MHVSSLLLVPLLITPVVSAAKMSHAHNGAAKRHGSHVVANQVKIKKDAAVPRGPTPDAPLSGGKKGKRLVRKKRSTNAACAVPSNGTLSAVSSSPASSVAASFSSSPASSAFLSSTAIADAAYTSAGPASSSSSSSSSASASAIGDANFANGGTVSTSATSTWSSSAQSTSTSSSVKPSSTSNSDWTKVEEWSGSTFFDNVNFWSYSDPTHGTVQFQSASDAWNSGLISINSAGHAIMAVDTTQKVTGGRKAIRIHGNRVWTGGLVLMDAIHMPTGCGTWPAWWQNGPNWPAGGEIDILEGVNAFTENQVSLHTNPGCTMPSDLNNNQLAALTTGSYNSYDCSSTNTANQGCGARDGTNDNSYGANFNNVGGGVYAMEWVKTGIKVWWFPRSSIPADITNDTPDPSGWGTPVANFPSTSCNIYEFFYDHYNIFDTTLCGDWAGADGVWNYAGYAGQDQSCAAMTGYSTCSDYVLNSGSSFANAYWEVASVKYFNSTSLV